MSRRRPAPPPPATPAGWTAALRSARWLGPDRYEVSGWALLAGEDPVRPTVHVAGLDVDTEPAADDQIRRDVDVVVGDPSRDLRPACFRAVVDVGPALEVARELAPGSRGPTYRVRIRVGTAEGPFRQIFRAGSPGRLLRSVHGDRQLEPRWDDDHGLSFAVRRPATLAADVALSEGVLLLPTGTLAAASWERDGTSIPAEVQLSRNGVRVAPPPAEGRDARWKLRGRDRSVTGDVVRLGSAGDLVLTDGATTVELTPTGVITARAVGAVPIDRMEVAADRLELAGPGRVPELVLRGGRTSVTAITANTATGWTAAFELVTDDLAVPSDVYTLDAADRVVRLTGAATDPLGRWALRPLLRVRPEWSGGGLRLRVRAPVDPAAWGAWAEASVSAQLAAEPDRPADTVYLESFSGRRVADSPLAIRHELARRHPELRRVWGVADGSVAVPAGDQRVIIGTRAWREARATARTLVANDWLHGPSPRPFQRVLQTWHGTPLKRLALDRADRDENFVAALRTEVAGWDVLLSQSPYMTAVLRRAYGFGREIAETGYPRNDLLGGDLGPTREAVRQVLGIGPDQQVLLYAPTWRDDRRRLAGLLDLTALAQRLGSGWTVLVRGHTEMIEHEMIEHDTITHDTITHHAAAHEPTSRGHLVDVTLWPVVEELFAATDVLVTDYSSVMFDFAVTGRPMVFFVPDLEDYRATRGWYFDLGEEAPGPLVTTIDDLVDAVHDDPVRWAEPYAVWRERYVPHDDGRASSRVVDLLWGG